MKFAHPEIETLIDTDNGRYNTLVIENQDLFVRLLTDISKQINGQDGVSVLSENDRPVAFAKRAVILDTFVPFELNRKPLLNKILAALERKANEAEHYEATASILAAVENYLDDLGLDIPCELDYSDITIASLLKATGLKLMTDGESLPERLLDYMELITEYDAERLFFLVNIRSYISDEDMEALTASIQSHGYHVIGIEACERPCLQREARILIDSDLCEID